MKKDWKDIGIRALKTFVQTFISCVCVSLSGVNFLVWDQPTTWWVGIVLPAVSAGASAVWNAVVKPIYMPEA